MPSLDGWRAIAIILVLGSHMSSSSHFPQSLNGLNAIFDGELGVRIFFVLSGFLISLLLIKESERNGHVNLGRFYARRALRIIPIYVGYLACLAVLSASGLYHDQASSWIGCLTFTRNMVGRGDSGTIHFWSLAVEEQFYLIWPIIFSRLRLWNNGRAYVAVLLLPIVLCPFVREFLSPEDPGATFLGRVLGQRSILAYADSLAVGCLGAWMVWKSSAGWEWRPRHSTILLFSLAAIAGGHVLQWIPSARNLLAFVVAFQAWAILGCIVLGTHPDSPGFALLNSKAMILIGILSYSIYVWHFAFLGHFMGPHLSTLAIYDWKVWLFPALAVSALSFRFLEMPFMRLRGKLRA